MGRLDAVTRREQTLNLFHALGKILYNKRTSRLNIVQNMNVDRTYEGLGDPSMEDEDQEQVAVIKGLPSEDALPAHLRHFECRTSMIRMEVSLNRHSQFLLTARVQSFIPTIPVDASSFALWIHQSFPSFCAVVSEVSVAADALCTADVIRSEDDIVSSQPGDLGMFSLDSDKRSSGSRAPMPSLILCISR